MNCTKGKALLVAGLVLVMAVGVYAAQQQQQQQQQRMRQVQGEITSLQTQNVNNQRMMVAEVETQDGQTMQVILGSPDQLGQLDLQEGDQIQVQGSRTQLQGQSALQAQQIRANNQRVRIQQQGMGQQQQQQGRRMGQQQQMGGFQPSLIQANNLIGKEVMGPQEESLGSIEELILHADQSQIQYAVLSAGEAIDMPGQICLMPWNDFEVQGEQEQVEVTLLMDRNQLMNLPNYEESDWQNASIEDINAEIEQHFGQQQGQMRQQGQMQGRQRQQSMGGMQQQQQQGSQMRQQQMGGQQQVQGQITSLQRQQVNNQPQIVAEVETQDGQTMWVILGSPDQLGQISLLPGDQIRVQGSRTQLQGQSALRARQIRANNQQIQIQQQGGQMQRQGSQRQQMQGGRMGQRQSQDDQYGQTLGMDRRRQGGSQMGQQDDTDYFILYDEGEAEIYRMDGQQQQRQRQQQAQQYFKLTNLIGMDVEDQQQEQFGSLEDIVVDTREGRLVYGIVSYGGFLGIAEDMAAVPWNSLEIMPQENVIVMNANQDVLEQFAFEQGDIQRLEDQQYSRRLHEQFNEEPYWVVYGYAPADTQGRMQQGQQQVQGEVTSLQMQRVNNRQMMVAEVQTQDGQTQQVILGSPDQLGQLDLQEGDQISVQGSQTQLQGQSAIQAQQIRANNQRVRIQQQGGMGQQQQQQGRMTQGQMQQSRRQQSQAWGESGTYSQAFDPANTQSYSGTIQSTGTFRLGQGAMDGLRLRIRTDDGQTQTVYAGPKAYVNQQGLKLQNGDQVEITAAEGNLNNRQVLIASEIKKDNQSITFFDDQGKPEWNVENLMQGGMQPRNGEQQRRQQQQQDGEQQNGEQQKQQQKQQQQQQNGDSQSGQMKQVQGEITSLQMQQVKNQRQMVAEVKTQDGQTQQVILGNPDELGQLNLKKGDQIRVSGQSTQFNQQSAIQAQEIRANNQQIKVGQKAGASSSMGGGSQSSSGQ